MTYNGHHAFSTSSEHKSSLHNFAHATNMLPSYSLCGSYFIKFFFHYIFVYVEATIFIFSTVYISWCVHVRQFFWTMSLFVNRNTILYMGNGKCVLKKKSAGKREILKHKFFCRYCFSCVCNIFVAL